jgi:kynurenine formamidase
LVKFKKGTVFIMIFEVEINNEIYELNTKTYHDISIPLNFNEEQPNTYNIKKASSHAFEEKGGFIGDTRKGGSCNFEVLNLIPHCNGTHTECLGHITNQRISVHQQLKDIFIAATLITVSPSKNSNDSYKPRLEKDDLVISKKSIEGALQNKSDDFLKALIIRTSPNSEDKKRRDYIKDEPPFFSLEAMRYIVEKGVEHLLVDMPSVDRAFDDGQLNTHHIFWNLKENSHEVDDQCEMNKTITEMIYVSDTVTDGTYMLNLQIAPFVSDATPSRPILFDLNKK